MKQLVALAVLRSAIALSQARKGVMTRIATPAQPDAIQLYFSGSLPAGSIPEVWDNVAVDFPGGRHLTSRIARNVSIQTITPVLPEPSRATGAAILVAPGGGFWQLSMDSEGFDVAHWLADHGIAAFVLKYRLNPLPVDEAAFQASTDEKMSKVVQSGGLTEGKGEPRAYADDFAALKLIRAGADKWHIGPKRLGMIGISAGAMTIRETVLSDKAAAGPDFVGYIYGPMVTIKVPTAAPPCSPR